MPKMPLLGGGEVFAMADRESAAFSPDNRVFVGVVVGECSCFLLAMFSESLGVGVGLTVGLVVGLIVGVVVGLAVGVSVGVSVGLRMGLVVG